MHYEQIICMDVSNPWIDQQTKQEVSHIKKSTSQGIWTNESSIIEKELNDNIIKMKDEKQATNMSEQKKHVIQDILIKKKSIKKGPLSMSKIIHVDIKPVYRMSPEIISRAVSPKHY